MSSPSAFSFPVFFSPLPLPIAQSLVSNIIVYNLNAATFSNGISNGAAQHERESVVLWYHRILCLRRMGYTIRQRGIQFWQIMISSHTRTIQRLQNASVRSSIVSIFPRTTTDCPFFSSRETVKSRPRPIGRMVETERKEKIPRGKDWLRRRQSPAIPIIRRNYWGLYYVDSQCTAATITSRISVS